MIKLTRTKEKIVRSIKAEVSDRQWFIGGSDAGVIMNCNPWKSPYTLWAEKVGKVEAEDISDKEAVWWGTQEEDLIRKRFEMKTGMKCKKSGVTYSCKEYPFLRGHIDRLVVGKKAGLECKSLSAFAKYDFDNGQVPDTFFWQCQFYMMLTGFKQWYLAIKQDHKFHVLLIEYNEEAVEELLAACLRFWEMVTNGEEPDTDGSDSTTETLNEMYPDSVEGELIDLSEVSDQIKAIEACKLQKKDIDTLQNGYTNAVKAILGENEAGFTDEYFVSWKTAKNGNRPFKIKEIRKGEKENG